jgi:ELWxxDGT repeat protein
MLSFFRRATQASSRTVRAEKRTRLGVERLEGRDAPAVLFSAYDAQHGQELWTSDGQNVTHIVKDINVGVLGSNPSGFVQFNGKVYFAADDGASGIELWASDGTANGTYRVADLAPGVASSSPSWMTVVGNRLLFSTQVNGASVLNAMDANEVISNWVINPNGTGNLQSFYSYNNRLFFSASDGQFGLEPWTWAAGETPHMVADIRPGPQGSLAGYYTGVGNTVVFGADDGVAGYEPWAMNATNPNGVWPLADINVGAGAGMLGVQPVVFNGAAYFVGNDPANTGREVWKTDGTVAGTVLLKDIEPGVGSSDPYGFTVFNGWLYFAATDAAAGREVWRTDGTAAGTTLAADLIAGAGDSNPSGFTVFNNQLYFQANTAANGVELYRLTALGTWTTTDIAVGPNSSKPSNFYVSGNQLFFTATNNQGITHVWVSDVNGNLREITTQDGMTPADVPGFVTI